ncbi:hypothetical protein BFF94_008890 [Burkholderia catarinensis]|nr:hypothetical protein BFF94_008890 [Burkholderia catarinensis]
MPSGIESPHLCRPVSENVGMRRAIRVPAIQPKTARSFRRSRHLAGRGGCRCAFLQSITDTPIQIGNQDTYAVLAGKWVIELAELDSLNKADSSAAKRFFATAVDRFRNFYGKRATDVPRQCVFAGAVNFDTYLKDEAGNRRYWPLRVGDLVDIDRQLSIGLFTS